MDNASLANQSITSAKIPEKRLDSAPRATDTENDMAQTKRKHDAPQLESGDFVEIEQIATGGMSKIYRAKQTSLDRYIVIKRLRQDVGIHPEAATRFQREAKTLSSVLHQNVAHVYDYVDKGSSSYILMEYIDGVDLSSIIEKIGAIPPHIAAAIILNVAKGVSHIHAHRLIHRDIKPSNIRITTRGEVKLMDFGIVVDERAKGLTRPGVMVGSPYYLSPEQVLGDTVTAKTDTFLLGISLYEMLTGERPFQEKGDRSVFQQIRDNKYTHIRRVKPNIPRSLAAIVKKCLRHNPRKRYGDVKDLILDLERYLGQYQSSKTHDLVLEFLDNESLLYPAVPYSKISASQGLVRKYTRWLTALGVGLAVSALITLGYNIGRGNILSALTRPESPFSFMEKKRKPPVLHPFKRR